MKKIISIIAIAAITMSSLTACGDDKPKKRGNKIPVAAGQIDTLSYMLGVNFGTMAKQQFGIFNLDIEQVKMGINDFLLSGDVEEQSFLDGHQQFMAFMNDSKTQSFGRAKFERDRYQGDRPDTLPALPELYTKENSRTKISYIIGTLIGADIKMSVTEDDELSRAWVIEAFSDAQNIENFQEADKHLNIPAKEINEFYVRYTQERRMREHEKAMQELEENKAAGVEWLKEVEQQEGVQKTESGILYRIERQGNGTFPTKDDDVVLVNYEGKVRTGKIFDSSYERNEPISFPLNGVIKGWTEGMKLIDEGGEITLWIPSDLAYGDRRRSDVIGPGEALMFKVELLEVNPEK